MFTCENYFPPSFFTRLMLLVDATFATVETLLLSLPDICILDTERIRANRLQIRRNLPDSDPLLNIPFDNFALKIIYLSFIS